MKAIGYLLNLPWTIIGILLALLSIPRKIFIREDAIVFRVRSFWWSFFVPRMNYRKLRGITNGNIISLSPLEERNDLAHELVHVRQFMQKPFIQAFLYWIEARKFGHGLDNKFEREAYETTGSMYRGG